jgi:lipopolysaccharide transport system ATP-binding protein
MGAELRINENRVGSMEMEIVDVRLIDRDGAPVSEINSRDMLRVELDIMSPQVIESPIFGVRITREDDTILCDCSTAANGLSLPAVLGSGKILLEFERLDLVGDKYYIDVGVYKRDWSYAYDYHWHAYPLTIRTSENTEGLLLPPHHWEHFFGV